MTGIEELIAIGATAAEGATAVEVGAVGVGAVEAGGAAVGTDLALVDAAYAAGATTTGATEAGVAATAAAGAGATLPPTTAAAGFSWASALPFVGAAGGLVSAGGSILSAQGQAKAATYNAAVDEQQAQDILTSTQYAIDQNRIKAQRILATEATRSAASGVQPEGSPLLVMAQTASDSELDSFAIGYSGQVRANAARSRIPLDQAQADQLTTSSYFTAGSSLLTGATKLGTALGAAKTKAPD